MKTIELSTELLNTQTAGLDAALVEKIKADFAPYFEALKAEQETAFDLVVTSADQKDLMKAAGDKRKAAVKKRTGADDLRKGMKAGGISYLDAIQKVFNALEKGFKEVEEHYRQQETFVERMEQIRIDELRKERNIELWPLKEFVPMGIDAGVLSDEDYAKILSGCKAAKAQKEREEKEAELEAERKRKADEVARIQAEKDRIQNKKLQNQLAKAKKEKEKLEQEAAKAKADRDAADRKAEQDRHEAAQAIEQERKNKLLAEAKLQQMQADKAAADKAKLEADKAKIVVPDGQITANDDTNLDKLQAKIKKILLELPKGETDTANAVVKQVQQFLKDAVSIIDEHILPF